MLDLALGIMNMILGYMLLGVGPGTCSTVFPKLQLSGIATCSGQVSNGLLAVHCSVSCCLSFTEQG